MVWDSFVERGLLLNALQTEREPPLSELLVLAMETAGELQRPLGAGKFETCPGGKMKQYDRGVRANSLDRKFGTAGRGVDMNRFGMMAERRARDREQKEATQALKRIQNSKPLKPPTSKGER